MKQSTFSFLLGVFIITVALVIKLTNSTSYATENHIHLAGNPLLSTNRTELGFCIDNFTNQDFVTFSDQIQKIIKDIEQDTPLWEEQGYKNYPIQIKNACPNAPYLLNLSAKHPILSPLGESIDYPVPIVQIPSDYRFHIYVVPDEVIMNHFQETDIRTAPQEMLCDGEQCYEITTGLYFSAKEITDTSYIRSKIQQLLFPMSQ